VCWEIWGGTQEAKLKFKAEVSTYPRNREKRAQNEWTPWLGEEGAAGGGIGGGAEKRLLVSKKFR